MAAARTAFALQGEPLDALVWRETGEGAGVLEAVLAVNPGLARSAHALAAGQAVTIPADVTRQRTSPLINLWD